MVWAVRRTRPGQRAHAGFAALYYGIMRRIAGMEEMPAQGADFFLVDRIVIDAFSRFPERNISVLALITWLGFRQVRIEYDKQARAGGQSGWTFSRNVKLVVDSITAFSGFPIRLCAYAGATLTIVALGLGVTAAVFLPSIGSALLLLLAAIVGLGGLQLLAVGVVGEYVWRALEEARRRPHYLIERLAGQHPAVPAHTQ